MKTLRSLLLLSLCGAILLSGCATPSAPIDATTDAPETEALLQTILGPYVGKLDALVLGCTHYPFVARNIASIMGPETQLLHGGKGTARETKRRLEQSDLLNEGEGSITILNSSPDPKMLKLSHALLTGGKISFEDE